jgi:hypothetical protein
MIIINMPMKRMWKVRKRENIKENDKMEKREKLLFHVTHACSV